AHYKKVLESITDLETSRLIQGNIALCERTQAVDAPQEPVDKEPASPRTIVRVERRTDPIAITALGLGALGIGTSVGLYMASGASRDAARNAPTLDDNRSLNDRANRQRMVSFIVGGAGLALAGLGIYRLVTARDEQPATNVT